MSDRCVDERTCEPESSALGGRKTIEEDDEAEFETMLKLEATGAKCTVQQYQFAEPTVELVVNDGQSVNVWQYPQSYWDRYLNWKQTRLSMEVV